MAETNVESIVTGIVWKIEKKEGDNIEANDIIMILESMKMEIPIHAPDAGRVLDIKVAEGDSVSEGQVVARLANEPMPSSPATAA